MIRKTFILILFITLITTLPAYALQLVHLTEGKAMFVEVSTRDLNVIEFPSKVKAYTKGGKLEIKIEGARVFVSFLKDAKTGKLASEPEEMFFVSNNKTYSMILVPKGIPAETVIAKIEGDQRAERKKAAKWERKQSGYIKRIKSLTRAMYDGVPPGGFTIESPKIVSRQGDTTLALGMRFVGATIVGDIYRAKNEGRTSTTLKEKAFYTDGVLAVSIEKHTLKPAEKTRVFIVRKFDGDVGAAGAVRYGSGQPLRERSTDCICKVYRMHNAS